MKLVSSGTSVHCLSRRTSNYFPVRRFSSIPYRKSRWPMRRAIECSGCEMTRFKYGLNSTKVKTYSYWRKLRSVTKWKARPYPACYATISFLTSRTPFTHWTRDRAAMGIFMERFWRISTPMKTTTCKYASDRICSFYKTTVPYVRVIFIWTGAIGGVRHCISVET